VKASKLLDLLPKTVFIGGHKFRLQVLDEDLYVGTQLVLGMFSPVDSTIALARPRLETRVASCVVETFLHELVHAAYWLHDIDDTDPQEKTVEGVSQGLVTILAANPWLTSWINKGLK
jgi:hypothetical protein